MSLIMHCEPCGKSFTGPVSYNQHTESDKHKRKVSNLKTFSDSNKKEVCTEILSPSLFEHSRNTLDCYICNLRFDSFENFQIHSNSPEHGKNIIKNTHKADNVEHNVSLIIGPKAQSNNAESSSGVIYDENDTVLPKVEIMNSQASFSFCNTCKKSFSGPEPYKQHIESAGHVKKIELEKKLASGINLAPAEFSCAPCEKTFSGVVPYDQHMNSDIHRKKIRSLQLREKFEVDSSLRVKIVMEPGSLNKENNPYYCNTCDIICSGPTPFADHNKGVIHLKNLLKAQRQKGIDDILYINNQIQELNMSKKDIILPGLLDKNENTHIAKLDESITVFLPDEEINFGEYNDKTILNSAELTTSSATTDEIDFEDQNNKSLKLPEKYPDESELNENALNVCSSPLQENISKNKTEEKSDIYQLCSYCNVKLFNKDEAINHYESSEHYQRRWI